MEEPNQRSQNKLVLLNLVNDARHHNPVGDDLSNLKQNRTTKLYKIMRRRRAGGQTSILRRTEDTQSESEKPNINNGTLVSKLEIDYMK